VYEQLEKQKGRMEQEKEPPQQKRTGRKRPGRPSTPPVDADGAQWALRVAPVLCFHPKSKETCSRAVAVAASRRMLVRVVNIVVLVSKRGRCAESRSSGCGCGHWPPADPAVL